MSGTVLPSSLLSFAEESYYDSFGSAFNNVALRVGIVKYVTKPESDQSTDKKSIEYDVITFQQDKDKGVIPITYRSCVTMDAFGGIGDFFEFIKSAPTGQVGDLKIDDGSYVLLLCIDGTSTRGIIVGALPHHQRKSTLTNAKDKHLEGEYNGLRFKVNDDGELTFTLKGKTDNKGVPKTKVGGSQFKMEKDGSVEINTRDLEPALSTNDNDAKPSGSEPKADFEKVRVDKTRQMVDVIARKDVNLTTGANFNLTTKDNANLKVKDLIVQAEGKANFMIKGVFDIKADGAMSVAAADLKVKSDAAVTVDANQVNINAQKIALGSGGTPAVTSLTQVIGIGNLGQIVSSTMIGPFSSVVTIAP